MRKVQCKLGPPPSAQRHGKGRARTWGTKRDGLHSARAGRSDLHGTLLLALGGGRGGTQLLALLLGGGLTNMSDKGCHSYGPPVTRAVTRTAHQ